MIPVTVRAAAGQSPARFLFKAILSLVVVAGAAILGREGTALAILIIFAGIAGPALRITALRTGGVLDRIRVSPVPRPAAALFFAGAWGAAVAAALLPAAALVIARSGTGLVLPLCTGILLAAALGTSAGLATESLTGAHLGSLLLSGALIAGTLLPGPQAAFLPYTALARAGSPVSPAAPLALLAASLALLSLISRVR